MLNLIDEAKAESVVANRFIEAADNSQSCDSIWHDTQRCSILKSLARKGYTKAREKLYQMFRKNDDSLDLLACEEIIELDGADGLIFVCEKLGHWLAVDPEFTIDDAPITFYDEFHGKGSASRVLESACPTNAYVKAYVGYVAAKQGEEATDGHMNVSNLRLNPNTVNLERKRLLERTAADVIEWVETTPDDIDAEWPVGVQLLSWGFRTSETELLAIVERLFAETNPSRILRYLCVFKRRKVPDFDELLLAFADHRYKKIRWVAFGVLSHIDDPRVRELALARLSPRPMLEGSLRMLIESYKPGDHDAIERAMFIPESTEDLHTLVFDLADIFERHPTPEAHALMLFVYEHSPCGNCRNAATRVLSLTGNVPSWLQEEAPFDAMETIREHFSGSGK